MTLTNDYRLGVLNGQRGVIDGIDRRRRSVTVTFDDDTTRTIPAEYLEDGGLDHAYAMTIHKAQGQTCDYCYVLGDEHLYREAGYSALTRGRNENHLHTARTEPDAEIHHDPEPERATRAWFGPSTAPANRNSPSTGSVDTNSKPDNARKASNATSAQGWSCEPASS